MAILPVIFRGGGERAIASYDFIDFLSNTGYVKFLGGATKDSVSTKYHLNSNAFYCASTATATADSDLTNSQATTATTANFVKVLDLDFDTSTFNIPATIRGDLISNLPFSAKIISNANDTSGLAYAVVDFKKVDAAAAETSLISVTSNIVTWDFDPTIGSKYFSTTSTIPLTNFKKGEKIRITVEIWMKDGGGSQDPCMILGHNPNNTAIAASGDYPAISSGNSVMQFLIPFRIDL